MQGKAGPLAGKHVVLIAADDEYRSEELIPQLAKILAVHHGCQCTVLFAVDPKTGFIDPGGQNIPGLEALDAADLPATFARFRESPDRQMKHFVDYVESGKPIIGLRTATHAFNTRGTRRALMPVQLQQRQILRRLRPASAGRNVDQPLRSAQRREHADIIVPGMEHHPIFRGVGQIWGPSDVYAITTLTGDSKPLLLGHVLAGMKPTDRPTKRSCPAGGLDEDLHRHAG